MSRYLSEDQGRKLQYVTKVKQAVADIHFATLDEKTANINELSLTLYSLQGYLGNGLARLGPDDAPELRVNMQSLWDAIGLEAEETGETKSRILERWARAGRPPGREQLRRGSTRASAVEAEPEL